MTTFLDQKQGTFDESEIQFSYQGLEAKLLLGAHRGKGYNARDAAHPRGMLEHISTPNRNGLIYPSATTSTGVFVVKACTALGITPR